MLLSCHVDKLVVGRTVLMLMKMMVEYCQCVSISSAAPDLLSCLVDLLNVSLYLAFILIIIIHHILCVLSLTFLFPLHLYVFKLKIIIGIYNYYLANLLFNDFLFIFNWLMIDQRFDSSSYCVLMTLS